MKISDEFKKTIEITEDEQLRGLNIVIETDNENTTYNDRAGTGETSLFLDETVIGILVGAFKNYLHTGSLDGGLSYPNESDFPKPKTPKELEYQREIQKFRDGIEVIFYNIPATGNVVSFLVEIESGMITDYLTGEMLYFDALPNTAKIRIAPDVIKTVPAELIRFSNNRDGWNKFSIGDVIIPHHDSVYTSTPRTVMGFTESGYTLMGENGLPFVLSSDAKWELYNDGD